MNESREAKAPPPSIGAVLARLRESRGLSVFEVSTLSILPEELVERYEGADAISAPFEHSVCNRILRGLDAHTPITCRELLEFLEAAGTLVNPVKREEVLGLLRSVGPCRAAVGGCV